MSENKILHLGQEAGVWEVPARGDGLQLRTTENSKEDSERSGRGVALWWHCEALYSPGFDWGLKDNCWASVRWASATETSQGSIRQRTHWIALPSFSSHTIPCLIHLPSALLQLKCCFKALVPLWILSLRGVQGIGWHGKKGQKKWQVLVVLESRAVLQWGAQEM